jgi:hypothetical protein
LLDTNKKNSPEICDHQATFSVCRGLTHVTVWSEMTPKGISTQDKAADSPSLSRIAQQSRAMHDAFTSLSLARKYQVGLLKETAWKNPGFQSRNEFFQVAGRSWSVGIDVG